MAARHECGMPISRLPCLSEPKPNPMYNITAMKVQSGERA